MGAIMNGMSVSGLIPAGGTFFVFSDYMRPAVRLAALSRYKTAFVWTHDSIGVGEDGPTHQPIEHLASLRAMPELNVIRPADANECAPGVAVPHRRRAPHRDRARPPEACPCSPAPRSARPKGCPRRLRPRRRSRCASTSSSSAPGPKSRCASTRASCSPPTGSRRGSCRFRPGSCSRRRTTTYRDSVLPSGVPKLAVEAGASFGWERYADDVVAIDHFGASAPGGTAMKEFGFTPGERRRARPRAAPTRRHSMTSAIARLNDFGQSPWYDNLARPLLTGGGLAKLVTERRHPGRHVEPHDPRQGDRRRRGLRRATARVRQGGAVDRGHLLGGRARRHRRPRPRCSSRYTTLPTALTASCRSRCRRSWRTTPTARSRRPSRCSRG